MPPFPNYYRSLSPLIPDPYFYPMAGAQYSRTTPTVPTASTSTSAPAEPEEMDRLGIPQLPKNPSYGSIATRSCASGSISPKLHRVPEEQPPTLISLEDAEEEVELDLEDQGYFVGEQPSPVIQTFFAATRILQARTRVWFACTRLYR